MASGSRSLRRCLPTPASRDLDAPREWPWQPSPSPTPYENLLRLSTKDRPCYCRMMSAPELSLRRIANLQAVTTPTNQM